MKKKYVTPETEELTVNLSQLVCISEDDVDEEAQLIKERGNGKGLWSDSENDGKLW